MSSAVGDALSGVIQNVLSGTAQSPLTSSTQSGSTSATLGKNDFLRLLVTQLQNQDPLNPMDNTQFVAQMAQFTSLEQLQNMNTTLQQLATQMGGGAGAASAASLLGRTVTANGTSFSLASGQAASLAFSLPSAAASVTLQVWDQSGAAVRTLSLGGQNQGTYQVSFDGLDDQGRPLPAGSYTYGVAATDANGRVIPGPYTSGGPVTGISTQSGQTVLLVDGQRVPLATVVGIQAGTTP